MKKIVFVPVAAAAVFLSAGCIPQSAPTPTVTVTKEAPTPQKTWEDQLPSDTPTYDSDVVNLALERTWAQLPASDKADFCAIFVASPNVTWQSFSEGLAEKGMAGVLTQAEFNAFFAKKCGGSY